MELQRCDIPSDSFLSCWEKISFSYPSTVFWLQISQLSLTFREIIYNYRKQPQCKPQIFRSVFVDWSSARRNGVWCLIFTRMTVPFSEWILTLLMFWQQRPGQEHVDIITFYNEIFIPSVKPLLVELGPAGTTTARTNAVPEANNCNDGMLLLKLMCNCYIVFLVCFEKFICIIP